MIGKRNLLSNLSHYKLEKLPIFNVLAPKLAKKLFFKPRQFYKEMYGGRALDALRASLLC